MILRTARLTYNTARRVVIAVVGLSVLLLGVIMIVTPGPAIVLIPAGLAILGIEFAWARVWLRRMRVAISRRNSQDLAQRAESHNCRARHFKHRWSDCERTIPSIFTRTLGMLLQILPAKITMQRRLTMPGAEHLSFLISTCQ